MKLQWLGIIITLMFASATTVGAGDSSTGDFLLKADTSTPLEKVTRLRALLTNHQSENLTGNISEGAIRLLLTDAEYQLQKQKEAEAIFELARKRLEDSPKDTNFARYVAVYDAVSTAQAVRGEWLTSQKRKEFLEWSLQAERELLKILPVIESSIKTVVKKEEEPKKLSRAFISQKVQAVRNVQENALKEDLQIITNAVPNRHLEKCITNMEEIRSQIINMDHEFVDYDPVEWGKAITKLNETIAQLKVRQQLKYNLWAEQTYRVNTASNDNHSDQKIEALYKQLGAIDIALIIEPSLSKAILQRMHELYEKLDNTKTKAKVRYSAIIQLEKRRSLNEF